MKYTGNLEELKKRRFKKSDDGYLLTNGLEEDAREYSEIRILKNRNVDVCLYPCDILSEKLVGMVEEGLVVSNKKYKEVNAAKNQKMMD